MASLQRTLLIAGGPTTMASNVQRTGIRTRRWQQQLQASTAVPTSHLQQHGKQQQRHLRLKTRPKRAAVGVQFSGLWSQLHVLSLHLLLLLLLLQSHAVHIAAEGNVGCHFVKTLCLEGSEVCYNDNIFGKCIPTTGVDVEDIEKNPLTEDQSHLLANMLEQLQGVGLGWDHPYVQCRIQGTLYSLQKQTPLPPNLCANLAPDAMTLDTSSSLQFGPSSALGLGPLRYTPPLEPAYLLNENLYYSPLKRLREEAENSIGDIFYKLQHERQQERQQQERQLRHDPLELAHFGKVDASQPPLPIGPLNLDTFLDRERARIALQHQQREAEQEAERQQQLRNKLELYQMLAASEPDPQPYQRNGAAAAVPEELPPPQLSPRVTLPEPNEGIPPSYVAQAAEDSNEMYFPENYANFKRVDATPRRGSFFRELAFVQQNPAPDSPILETHSPTAYKRYKNNKSKAEESNDFEQTESSAEELSAYDRNLLQNSLTPFEEEAMLAANAYPPRHVPKHMKVGAYTEGGALYMPARDDEERKEQARIILADMLGFTRHERLDVKKPGPLIGPPDNVIDNGAAGQKNNSTINKIETKEVLPKHVKDESSQSHKKKKVVKEHADEDHGTHTVDREYAYAVVKNPIENWSDGVRIINELANVLHMQGYFSYFTVHPHEVSFRVNSNNPEHKSATDVARAINENRGVKNNILRRLGVTILRAGVGLKIKSDDDSGVSAARIEEAQQRANMQHIMLYMFAGAGLAAVLVIFGVLTLMKRQNPKKDKMGGLETGSHAGAESCSRDYQDLCRARMAGKGNAGAEPVICGRITTLAKDNDRPPSSRSSTSSWCEEPALTNMDISTGHMVLSYMEDHLRNKGRLQREWEALCRYEAEPSARDAALQPQCASFNRPNAPLPYDHSRVVLNHLANADSLDYINASTITDHDPRAPAYVAAQGPLPTTLAHFWQMIWEQGAVVIVALCRLQENGEIACARYWPEEGAEVYHIYEVHLVSEHIWCDDYLVRSFYLKNLRTSETRTVTQFHFLSWPQNGVPPQPKALLDFRRKVNKSYRGRSCPIVVHGSAGAGRTGAYILLDLVLGRMNKGAREIDIAATLEHLRDQRAGLVATRQQFEFVLMAVAEEVHAILKALPANQSNEKRNETETAGERKETLKEEATAEEVTAEATTSAKAKAKLEAEKEKENEATAKEKVDKGNEKGTATNITKTTKKK